MSTSNTVDAAADLIRGRIRELKAERSRLEAALASLGDVSPSGRGTARPSGKRRRRRGGTRADQAVKLIGENPGISASEIAKQMHIKPNYLYRVLAELEAEGRVRKDGRSYSAAE